MKVLLTALNAKYIHSNPAVYSLKAFAEAYDSCGSNIEIAEFTINHRTDEILREIYRRKPEILAFSCYIWNMEMVEKLLTQIPLVLPDTAIWLGGPEVSYDVQERLQTYPQLAGIMMGEGEETFAKLMQAYAKLPECGREILQTIPGIAYRVGETVQVNPPRERLDMNRIPFIYRELQTFENRIMYYESSRGCPFSCSYCLSSIDKGVRFRDTELVKRELQFFLDQKAAQVKFVDRTFNCRHSHALEIWRYIKEHDNGVTNFHFEIAADLLNEEELTLLSQMRPGLVQLEIGVQSTNVRTLREIERVSEFAHLSRVVQRLQEKENIHLHLDLIAGLPYEDYDSFVQSFNDVYRLHPEQLQLGFLKVLKGSKMRQNSETYGLCYHPQPVYEVFSTKWISYEEILRLKEVEEMVEIYYNSGQFAHTVARLEQEFAHPFAMFAALADHCRAQNNAGGQISRAARFEVLRSFIKSQSEASVYDDLLLRDLYLRENSKSRPAWARDLSQKKKEMLRFYQQEEEARLFLQGYEGRSAKQLMHMTHLECFGEAENERWILFDYGRRNPLTQNAQTFDVTAQMTAAETETAV